MDARPPLIPNCKEPRPTHAVRRRIGPVAPPSGGDSTSWAQAGAAGPAAKCGGGCGGEQRQGCSWASPASNCLSSHSPQGSSCFPLPPPLQGCERVAPRPALRRAQDPPFERANPRGVFRTAGTHLRAGLCTASQPATWRAHLSPIAGHVMPKGPCGLSKRL
eukprot:SM000133S26842  [mRNA]  locus=s133:300843:301405:+ [translate_table: standard]